MKTPGKPITILYADDDADDRLLTHEAMKASRLANDMFFVEDGEELLEFLNNEGKYTDPKAAPLPHLVLLDLNMPRMDGREALIRMKGDPRLRRIPVVVLTTSNAETDILRSYDIGANSYIVKPVTFDALVQVMRDLDRYWLQVVELPEAVAAGSA